MEKKFYSNGKLLITGEYAVLDGAKSLAIPTKYGQSLTIKENGSKRIQWTSLDETNSIWFEAVYDLGSLAKISTSDEQISRTLVKILGEVKKLNHGFLVDGLGYDIETRLTFPKDWGLGTSSTLINNIAQWANVEPYELLENTFGGSGYDIACAQHNTPIIYQLQKGKPLIEEVCFNPRFTDQLFFVYLNKKQNSREGISQYRKLGTNTKELVVSVGNITSEMLSCTRLKEFELLMEKHESILSKTLKTPTVKELYFSDYKGAIKSLGAWGGDFILATGEESIMSYFMQKGYRTIIPFSEMIL